MLIKKVADISNDDNEKNINEFIKLKDEWSNIGSAGKKNEKNEKPDFRIEHETLSQRKTEQNSRKLESELVIFVFHLYLLT